MKKVKDFLFVEQSFYDTEKTKTAAININFIDSITCKNDKKFGDIVIIETNNARIMIKGPVDLFFAEFEEVLKNEEEW